MRMLESEAHKKWCLRMTGSLCTGAECMGWRQESTVAGKRGECLECKGSGCGECDGEGEVVLEWESVGYCGLGGRPGNLAKEIAAEVLIAPLPTSIWWGE